MEKFISSIEPFKMCENLYFVGSKKVSVHIIKTSCGLVMIDSGYPDMYEQIKNSMEFLGLDIKDVCAIIHSHGHFDHTGCTLEIKKVSNAKTYISRIDNDIVNGTLDLSWTEEAGLDPLEPFDCDVLIDDGDVITFGDTEIRFVSAPGHTKGTIAIFAKLKNGDETIIAGMHGGIGVNTLKREYLEKKNIPYEMRDIFRNNLHKLSSEKVDIVMGNHPEHNDAIGKVEKVKNNESLIDPSEWQRVLDYAEGVLDRLIEKEKQ